MTNQKLGIRVHVSWNWISIRQTMPKSSLTFSPAMMLFSGCPTCVTLALWSLLRLSCEAVKLLTARKIEIFLRTIFQNSRESLELYYLSLPLHENMVIIYQLLYTQSRGGNRERTYNMVLIHKKCYKCTITLVSPLFIF